MKCWWIFGHRWSTHCAYKVDGLFIEKYLIGKITPGLYLDVYICSKCGKVKIRMVKI